MPLSPRKRESVRDTVRRSFKEVEENEPSIVSKTRRKKGAKAAEKQKTAIALDKARRAGADIPKKRG